jgi:hypothetical protein
MRFLYFTVCFLFLSSFSFAQTIIKELEERGEAKVKIALDEFYGIANRHALSVDEVHGDSVLLYINNKQFLKLTKQGVNCVLVPFRNNTRSIIMASAQSEMVNWDKYPTYELYVEMMQYYAQTYSEVCKLDTIGLSEGGRLLLALKISDSVNVDEPEPEVFLTSSMHGDELTGYVLMLRLVDSLLSNQVEPGIESLIKNTELWINPLANPDGAYFLGNHTVSEATRNNKNNLDLNRNFPDFVYGEHPDGEAWQAETMAMMNFMQERNFVLSANFHGGIELMNYPWDCKYERHADNDWFYFVSREYADTAHLVDKYYMTAFDDGVTNGADWAVISGGRQDYVTYFCGGREITMEISSVKLVDSYKLPYYWEVNKQSLINYIRQAQYGVNGLVTDAEGVPLKAKLFLENHDKDSSWIYSEAETGAYFRMLKEGSYSMIISAHGYISKTIDFSVKDYEIEVLNIVLDTLLAGRDVALNNMKVYPNPASCELNYEQFPVKSVLNFYSMQGRLEKSLTIQEENGTIELSGLKSGYYLLQLVSKDKVLVQQLVVE